MIIATYTKSKKGSEIEIHNEIVHYHHGQVNGLNAVTVTLLLNWSEIRHLLNQIEAGRVGLGIAELAQANGCG